MNYCPKCKAPTILERCPWCGEKTIGRRPDQMIKARCPCCGKEVGIRIFKAKWQGEDDQAKVSHSVWVKNYSG